MTRVRFRLALGLALFIGLLAAPSALAASNIVVSQVYGGGGNTGATYKNDFIELYNRGTVDQSLTGWSVQYAATGGSSWQRTPLAGTIKAGGYYLVQEAQGAGGTTNLPSPDATGTIPMAAGAGKVVLMSNNTTITGGTLCPSVVSGAVDIVGFGTTTTTCSETAPTATLSNTTAALRKANGATDTDNNSLDFAVGAPNPRNSESAPAVVSTSPGSGATGVLVDSDVTITFSEPVNAAGSWYGISCTKSGTHTAGVTGGPTAFTLDPDADFVGNETCTVTVTAAQVTDQDPNDPPDTMAADYVFSFETIAVFACGDPARGIHEIQDDDLASDMVGSSATIEGVVVGDYQGAGELGGFYVQEEPADYDTNPATSEGIFVFTGFAAAPGDVVRLRGTVSEFNGLTEISSVDAFKDCGDGASVPATAVTLPVASLADLESYEGMLVDLDQTLTATEVFSLGRFGEVALSGAGRLYTPTAVAAPGAPARAVEAQNDRSRIVLDDGNGQQNIDPTLYPQGGLSATNTLRVGDSLPGGVTGVLDDRFGAYRIQPVGPISFTHTNPRQAAPGAVGGNLKVASFNVLNYFNGDGLGGGFPTARGATTPFEFGRQRAKEISALKAMNADIVGLMEMENDAPPNSAVEDLVAGLNDAMGAGTYAFVNTGVIGTDEIKVALIYKPSAVTPVGQFKTITSAVDPRFIDTRNRPSLAQTFQHNGSGGKLTVVVNHLKSKGSACAGDPDLGDGAGNCNVTRREAAAAIVDWLATDPTGSGDPDFLLIGDMNSYAFEDPIAAFEGGGFTNLVRAHHGLTPYSYVFEGESGYLDHALATSSLASQVTGITDWHINPDEPTVLDYNTEFKTANQVNTFYDDGPFRSSDHDPVVVGLFFNTPPTVAAGGPYTVGEGGSVDLAATGNDPDGGALTYAWDLDDNGTFETAGRTPSFSAAAIDGPGTRNVSVRVTDEGGMTAVSNAVVQIRNVAPTASLDAPASALAGFPFTIALTGATDPSPADAAGLTYAFDCGSGVGSFGAASSASCTFTTVGPHTVRGAVRDDDGGVTEYTATVAVNVTGQSLADLTRAYSSDPKVAEKLSVYVQETKTREPEKYVKEVGKERGKAFTDAEADVLIALVRAL